MISLAFFTAALQQQPPPPPETKQFSFWVGEWDCEGISYGQTETKTKGSNHITLEFDGHVIHEHFKMQGFVGESWSVYNAAGKMWHQTWVDNSGGYIPLTGTWADGKMTLVTLQSSRMPNARSRMVFSNVTEKAFDWDWESSSDGGTTWKLNWHLHYTRKR